MIEQIESKMQEVISAILEKPSTEITKSEYDILSSEFFRLKSKIDTAESNKRMAEMLATLWSK